MDQIKNLYSIRLDKAQWQVLEREVLKLMGFALITIGWASPEQAGQLTQGLEMLMGGIFIIRPIICQIWRNSVTQRIKEVSELPNVKGVVTDPQIADVILAADLKVVSNPDKLKGVTT